MREAGYPVLYFGWLFDSYVRSFMIFASLPKDYDFASFDVVYSKGRTRLLHYHSLDSSKESNKPLLLIYAPINKFHIMDISKDRSVVRNLLSKGLDVYLLDWGFPDWNDSGLSLEDYVELCSRCRSGHQGQIQFGQDIHIGLLLGWYHFFMLRSPP